MAMQFDRSKWTQLREVFTSVLGSKTQEYWESVFINEDACVTPVVDFCEVNQHPHNIERKVLIPKAGSANLYFFIFEVYI